VSGLRVVVTFDAVQAQWLDALAELNGASRQDVLRQALLYLAAREHTRVTRSNRLAAIAAAHREHGGDRGGLDYFSARSRSRRNAR
jgi:hypothetical protein